ncbi:hypothetical protein A2U01_0060666, partial [Trifolium medium]|nr:hypothetical protein [Trifolium medium]
VLGLAPRAGVTCAARNVVVVASCFSVGCAARRDDLHRVQRRCCCCLFVLFPAPRAGLLVRVDFC